MTSIGIIDEIKKEVVQALDVKGKELEDHWIKEVNKYKPGPTNIYLGKTKVKTVKGQFYHYNFGQVLKCVSAAIPVFLTGDAGSGKTTIAEQCAEALGLPYYCRSVCIQTSETEFMGYKNAHGDYVRTLFREAYEHGGVFLIDEIDNGNPNVLSVLNAALANSICAFPDAMIKKHDNFRMIASGNTIGRGATREYVGRLEMDLATLDRFAVITIDYDEKIETILSKEDVAKKVQAIRKQIHDKGIRLVVSPRASINISKLLKIGVSYEDAVDLCIFKGCDKSIKNQIEKSHLKLDRPKPASVEIDDAPSVVTVTIHGNPERLPDCPEGVDYTVIPF